MAASVIVDAGFFVALLSRRDTHHRCAAAQAEILDEPTLLTTERNFRLYRRHGRQAVPCILPA